MKLVIFSFLSLLLCSCSGCFTKKDDDSLNELKCPVILIAKSTKTLKSSDGNTSESNIIVVSSADGKILTLGGAIGGINHSEAAIAISLSRNIGDTLIKCK